MLLDEATLGSLLKCAVHWPGVSEPKSQTAAPITGVTPSSFVCDAVGISPSMMGVLTRASGKDPRRDLPACREVGPRIQPTQTRRNGIGNAVGGHWLWLPQGSWGSLVGPVPQTRVTKAGATAPENCAPDPAGEIMQEGHPCQREGLNGEHHPPPTLPLCFVTGPCSPGPGLAAAVNI